MGHQQIHKYADRAEISMFSAFQRIRHVEHALGTSQRGFVKHVKHIFNHFSASLKHNSAKITISIFVNLLMAPPSKDNCTYPEIGYDFRRSYSAVHDNRRSHTDFVCPGQYLIKVLATVAVNLRGIW